MSTTTKKPKGRPTKYKPDYDDIAYGACLLGANDGKLAEIFGVNEDTVNERKKKFPSFSEKIKQGKDFADIEVAKALYNRARGMTLRKQAVIKLKVWVDEESEVVNYVEEIAPDPTCIRLRLTNRQWQFRRDKKEVDNTISNKDDKPLKVESLQNLSNEELSNHIQSYLTWTTPKSPEKTW